MNKGSNRKDQEYSGGCSYLVPILLKTGYAKRIGYFSPPEHILVSMKKQKSTKPRNSTLFYLFLKRITIIFVVLIIFGPFQVFFLSNCSQPISFIG